jgi:hypothetical protein
MYRQPCIFGRFLAFGLSLITDGCVLPCSSQAIPIRANPSQALFSKGMIMHHQHLIFGSFPDPPRCRVIPPTCPGPAVDGGVSRALHQSCGILVEERPLMAM